MTFPLVIFLYIYFAFLVVLGIFCLIAIYHMMKFGFVTFTTFFATFIFIGVVVVMLYFSFLYIAQIDWSFQITLFAGLFDNTPF